MPTVMINTATASDIEKIMDMVVLAFSADPFERWLYPDPRAYLVNFRTFIKAVTVQTFESHNAYYVDGYAGAALWLPPDIHLDEEPIITALEQTLSNRKWRMHLPSWNRWLITIHMSHIGIWR